MEISFKWPSFYFCLLCFQLCNGNPITPSDTEIDSRTKLLTGIISLLLTVCCLVFLAACLCCPRRKSFEKFRNSPVVASSITDIDHGHVNPIANGEFTIFSPLSLPHFNNNVLNANDEAKARTVEDSVENGYDIRSWFNPTETDFPRDKLKYIKELGTGWFGKVVQGAAQNSNDLGQSWTPVVVRILEATSSQKEKILFLQDASIYRCGSHTNILSLVGRSLETVPFLLLQEYCPQGDLKGYLQSNKADAEKLLSTEYPLIWCCQLTSALKHIHENNMSHLDLASRNCQLTPNLTLKLGDYGLGPYTYSSDYYQGVHTVPVRWCAPESLVYTQTTIQPKKITHEANVWSLGVTMWEICECGEQPYKGLSDDEVISQVLESANVRLGRPTYSALYTDYIFRLMQSCWTSAESRPTVSQIDTMLTDLLQVHRNTSYETSDIGEFEKRWEISKPNTIVKTDHITDPLLTPDISINNNFSLSLNNLHGSLDNLMGETKITIENETLNDSLTSHRTSVSDISDPGLTKKELKPQFNLNSNLFQRTTSSGSETEDENWRNKVERGAYTEKVRQKSKSVTDLMVLTHVDYSESETETPLPSLDYRVNYKNVRLAGLEAPNNLENASLTFGSEGNLLSVQDTFQEELRKLQEVRRDSLPFVPDTFSQSSFSSNKLNVATSPSKLMQELNSSVDLKPANTVYNVYNVTISPIKVHNKLEKIIDMNQDVRIVDCKTSSNMMNGSESCDNVFEDFGSVNDVTSTSELDILRGEEPLQNTMEAVNLNVNFGSDSIKNDTHFNMFEYDNEDKLSSSVFQVNKKTLNHSKLEENGIDSIANEADISQSSFEESIAIVNEILEAAVLKIISREKINSKDKKNKRERDKEDRDVNKATKVQKEVDCELRAVQISNKKDEDILKEKVSEETINSKDKKIKRERDKEDRDVSKATKVRKEVDCELRAVQISNKKDEEVNVLKEKVSEETEDIQRNECILKDEIKGEEETKTKSETEVQNSLGELEEENDSKGISQQNIKETTSEIGNKTTVNLYTVPKLTDLILDNKPLMDLLTKDAEEESREIEKQNDKTDEKLQIVDFDLSLEQEEIIPNSLTHSTLFTSTPFRKREISLPSEDKYSSINLFSVDNDRDSPTGLNYSLETWDNFLGTTLDNHNEHLENMFDSFTSEPQSLLFIEGEKCVEESQVDNQTRVLTKDEPIELNATYNLKPELNGTYNLNDKLNVTYKLTDKESDEALNGTYKVDRDEAKKVDSNPEVQKVVEENALNSTYSKDKTENVPYNSDDPNEGTFENGCGWFLHPQPTTDLSGEIQAQSPCTDSYIGFGIDDEIMSAIRNELLSKLPHAQGASAERVQEEEDWDTCERNEVFLRYNVYNTPLSPIPEESCVEEADDSPLTSPKPEYEIDEAGWSGQTDTDTLTHEIETISAQTLESPLRSQFNRHTPSQDSCCSNDTLFNLEELIYATTELEKDTDFHSNLVTDIDDIVPDITIVKEENKTPDNANNLIVSKKSIDEFLSHERNHSVVNNKLKPTTLDVTFQTDKQICPLPSPEDKPWKQLPASLQNYKNITSMTHLTLEEKPEGDNSGKEDDSTKENMKPICDDEDIEDDADKSEEENLTYTIEKAANPETPSSPTLIKLASMGNSLSIEEDVPLDQEHSDKENVEPVYENTEVEEHLYENDAKVEERLKEGDNLYENSDVTNNEEVFKKVNSEVDSFEDYVNIVNMENDKNRLECDVDKDTYINIYGHEEEVHSEDENIYGILTDIRFTGPTDSQMMSTSFSEHNDEQGWESGSDSRSSSSGEFIWKEGEHEESLKALRAAPQDVLENLKPMEGIAEDAFEESDVSSSFTDDEETPEFVPSAWDKFAIPSKSALRSPEKTLNKSDEKKPKGVWFKKQKYHCIYEYPKEPESPVLQSQDLWKPQTDIQSFTDWEFDGEVFVPRQESDDTTNYTNRSNILSSQNLYHLTSITDLNPEASNSTNSDDEFFISSSARPFHAHSLSSQFFPGSSSSWNFENATPDSGVEDIISGSLTDPDEFSGTVPTLKQLASVAVSKKKLLSLKNKEVMGGLRHTRNKLKLDLPPSPSAFTTDKPWFHLDSLPTVDRLIEREKPTFTTFGKSRFMVQHVDTPPEADKSKNVSFEALPYQPDNPVITDHSDPLIEKSPIKSQEEDDKCKLKVEVVRGEASLLDSGDEDSGIESASTLERKISTSQL